MSQSRKSRSTFSEHAPEAWRKYEQKPGQWQQMEGRKKIDENRITLARQKRPKAVQP
jgi:hypothetical protein